jgi:hypothetical protein
MLRRNVMRKPRCRRSAWLGGKRLEIGGGAGIRTQEALARPTVFKPAVTPLNGAVCGRCAPVCAPVGGDAPPTAPAAQQGTLRKVEDVPAVGSDQILRAGQPGRIDALRETRLRLEEVAVLGSGGFHVVDTAPVVVYWIWSILEKQATVALKPSIAAE